MKLNYTLSCFKRRLPIYMKAFVFLNCMTAFAFSSKSVAVEGLKIDNAAVVMQSNIVKGKIVDASGQSLPGVNIVEKGTNNGTSTDFDGSFTLKLINKDAILIVSYIGFNTKQVVVKGQANLSIVLEAEAFSLNEVVMVGYSKVKKSDLTGAVTSVKPSELNQAGVSNAAQMLQGRVAGLYVNSANQNPGATPNFLLRGVSSLQDGAGQPLIVIDGFPMEDASILNTLNPDDIAQMDVLKDASATAIYGARGANGVIIVTTKNGSKGSKIQVDYRSQISTQTVAKTVDMMNGDQYARFYLDYTNDPTSIYGPNETPHQYSEIGRLANTNWQNELINRSNLIQDHSLAISGGFDNVKYRFSTGYYSGLGVISPSSYKRYNVAAKISLTKGKFNLDTDFNLTNEKKNNVTNSYDNALTYSPSVPVYDENGELSAHASSRLSWLSNPLFNKIGSEDFTETNTTRVKIGVGYEILDGLRIEADGGITQRNPENFTQTLKLWPGSTSTYDTEASLRYDDQRTLYGDAFLRYNKVFNKKHNLKLLLGGTVYHYRTRYIGNGSADFPYSNIGYYNINAGLQLRTLNSGWTERKTLSSLFRGEYNYDQKYYVTATVRRDGATQFGQNRKWGIFPSVSFAYRIDQEDYFKNNVNFLNTLKLRVGYGEAGNDNIPSFRTQSLLNFVPTNLGAGTTSAIAIVGNYRANPDLRWEVTRTLNLGLEFGNKKWFAQVDWYNKRATDVLIDRNLPAESGPSLVTINKGVMDNKGIEAKFNLYLDFFNGKLKWSPGIWMARNKNKIVDFNGDSLPLGGIWINRTNFGNIANRQEGYSTQPRVGYDYIGVWQTSEATEAATYNAIPGDPKFKDMNNDSMIDEKDKKFLGDANPIYTAGFVNKFNYKNFELSFFFEGVFDKTVVNANRIRLMFPTLQFGRNLMTQALDRWTPTHPSNDVPSLTNNQSTIEKLATSNWTMQDASFIRLRDVSLSYSFKLKNSSFKSLKVFGSVSNLITISKYGGINPDVNGIDSDYNLNPYTRTVALGVSTSF